MPPFLSILRLGDAYQSLDAAPLADPRSGAAVATIGQANAGLIRRDLRKAEQAAAALRALSCAELIGICARAAELFMNADLPLGDRQTQSPRQYVESLSATSGLPHNMCRQNMRKIETVLARMDIILRGLTRGLDLSILDRGTGEHDGVPVSYYPTANALGVVLPSNSPGVNSIWLPAIALKTPVIIKPGREEPWTPWRIIQAMLAAGCPKQALSFYPTDHEGADAIMTGCGRAIIFGDDKTLKRYAGNPAIQLHGTGRSKIIIGADQIDDWPRWLDVMVESILANGGRSCINASCILVPSHGDAIAAALAERLAAVRPCDSDDERAQLSAFANPAFAQYIDQAINDGLKQPGAEDVTAGRRNESRLVQYHGFTYLLPTIIRCRTLDHPLANTEFLFPFTSVVQCPQPQMLEWIGPTLALTAVTRDSAFTAQLLRCPLIDRLNLGPTPTCRVDWSQPHEGNLFEFLYRRRALQRGQDIA